jgi:hypothetical protein
MCKFNLNSFLYGVEPVYKDQPLDCKLVVTRDEHHHAHADSQKLSVFYVKIVFCNSTCSVSKL